MSTGHSPFPPRFNPIEFLNFAHQSASTTLSEATLRICVGRVYYALFLIARDRLYPSATPPRSIRRKSLRGRSEEVGIHKAVIDEVRSRHRTTGDQLSKLQKLRRAADYWLTPSPDAYPNWQKNWQDADIIAHQILLRIQQI